MLIRVIVQEELETLLARVLLPLGSPVPGIKGMLQLKESTRAVPIGFIREQFRLRQGLTEFVERNGLRLSGIPAVHWRVRFALGRASTKHHKKKEEG
jgi:hypothetical protein